MIRNFAELLGLWTPKQLSRLLRVPYSTAAAMYQRGAIGPAHWSRLIQIAEARGEIITADMLVAFYDQNANDGRVQVHIRASRLKPAIRPKSKSQASAPP
jgi:hypothetical protein